MGRIYYRTLILSGSVINYLTLKAKCQQLQSPENLQTIHSSPIFYSTLLWPTLLGLDLGMVSKTRPLPDSEAATMYKLKGQSSNMPTGQDFK